MKPIANITGQKIGKWTAIMRVVRKNRSHWLCRCECGKEKLVIASSLLSGESRSCRSCAMKGESIVGQKFGEWIVIEEAGKKHRHTIYLCECSCGNRSLVKRPNLISGESSSCGKCPKPSHGTLFSVYAKYINWIDEVFDIGGQLHVLCAYCGKKFIPTPMQVSNRRNAITEIRPGYNRFYCSEECKNLCPSFNKVKYPLGKKNGGPREVHPDLRKVVFERDSHMCQICHTECALECHHIVPYMQNKIMANDPENCITLCSSCHKFVHSLPGCRYRDLRCNEQNMVSA